MSGFAVNPLMLALAASAVGFTLLVWHRHGGPRWMFALGGFFFILGRVLIAAICALMLFVTVSTIRGMTDDGHLLGGTFAALLLGIAGWSIFAVVRAVLRDTFGAAQEDGAKIRYADRNS